MIQVLGFPINTPKRKPRCEPGRSSGVERLAGLGVGASAKLLHQLKTDPNVPKISVQNCSPLFIHQVPELPRVDDHRGDIGGHIREREVREPLPPSLLRRTILPLASQARWRGTSSMRVRVLILVLLQPWEAPVNQGMNAFLAEEPRLQL